MGFGIRAGAIAQRALPVYGGTAPPIAPLQGAPFRPAVSSQGGFPEVDCVRRLLTGDVIVAAEQRATRIGVGADRVLIAAGQLSEETYLRALATSLGVAFEPLDGVSGFHCPLDDERLLKTPAVGLLPLIKNKGLTLVVALRGTAARRLTGMIRNRPELARYFRFTTAERLNRFVLRNAAAAITAHAFECLDRKRPNLSAINARSCCSVTPPAVLVLAGIAGPALAPSAITQILALILSALFLAWLGLRVAVPIAATPARGQQPELPDNILPVYTVIVALYREAASVNRLLSAIARLDYPAEKLDVILAIEADDKETRAAITACNTRLPVSLIAVPAGGPRTKPKALNAALPFARGTFTVIYDAEDDPEPAQLRCSLAWSLALMPLHWLLLSLAAWRALVQLFAAPYKWEKTEHGLAKSPRHNPDSGRALIELERLLGRLKQAGERPPAAGPATGTCAGRLPHPVASASG